MQDLRYVVDAGSAHGSSHGDGFETTVTERAATGYPCANPRTSGQTSSSVDMSNCAEPLELSRHALGSSTSDGSFNRQGLCVSLATQESCIDGTCLGRSACHAALCAAFLLHYIVLVCWSMLLLASHCAFLWDWCGPHAGIIVLQSCTEYMSTASQ